MFDYCCCRHVVLLKTLAQRMKRQSELELRGGQRREQSKANMPVVKDLILQYKNIGFA